MPYQMSEVNAGSSRDRAGSGTWVLTGQRAFQLLAVLLMLLSVAAAARVGLQRNLHDSLADATWGRVQFAIGAALSSRYHGAYGYTSYRLTREVLAYSGLTGDPVSLGALGMKLPENLRDRALIEGAIAKAADYKASYDPDVAVGGSSGEDVGLVDYVRLAFSLFGNRLSSFFWTYFALISISLIAAAIAFRAMPGLLAVFVLYALALPILLTSELMDFRIVGILDPRFLSTLSLIPAAHIALAMLARQRSSIGQVALVILQAALLVFAYWIRSSAIWTLLALSLLAAVLAGRAMWRRDAADLRRLWPFAILSAFAAAHLVYVAVILHPIYQKGDERPHHGLWHAFIYSLAKHPGWHDKYAPTFGPAGDDLSERMAKAYVLAHPPPDPDAVYLTPERQHLRIGVVEAYKRKAFLQFAANDPKFVLETFLVHTFRVCWDSFIEYLSSLQRISAVGWTLLALALLLIAALLAVDRRERRRTSQAVLVATAGLVLATVPIALTAPSFPVMADQFYMLTVAGLGWAVVAVSHAMALAIPGEARRALVT